MIKNGNFELRLVKGNEIFIDFKWWIRNYDIPSGLNENEIINLRLKKYFDDI